MSSLQTKASKFIIVINEKTPNELEAIQEKLEDTAIFNFYASIIHDKDTVSNGELKTKHLHLYGEKTSQIALKTLLNELCDKLSIEQNQISIEKANNDFLPIQYLTHKNDPNKYQYDIKLVYTNNRTEFNRRYNQIYQKPLTEEDIKTFILNDSTIADLIDHIGLDNTKKYLPIFREFQKEPNQAKTTYWFMTQFEDYQDCIKELYQLILSRTGISAKIEADKILEKFSIKI